MVADDEVRGREGGRVCMCFASVCACVCVCLLHVCESVRGCVNLCVLAGWAGGRGLACGL